MSKYLIINTTTFAASGPGSQSGKILVGGDNIISIVPNGSSGIRIVYQANVQTVLNFSGTIVVGDYSVITFITKEIEVLLRFLFLEPFLIALQLLDILLVFRQ